MFYRAVNKFTNEMWESESFKEVFDHALTAAKLDLHCDPDRVYTAIRLQRFDDAIDIVEDSTGREWTYYFGMKQIAYMQVNRKYITIAYYGHGTTIWRRFSDVFSDHD